MQEAMHFSVTWIDVYTVHILVTLIYDGNCTDRMHVISCKYPVSTNMLLKIDIPYLKIFYVPCPVSEGRYQTVGHPTVRMALKGTFPQNFRTWSTAKQITNEPTPCFIKRPFNKPMILLSTFLSGF